MLKLIFPIILLFLAACETTGDATDFCSATTSTEYERLDCLQSFASGEAYHARARNIID